MNVTLSMYLIVCPLVFLAAVVDAIGGGGGLISLPAYYLAGLSPTLAAGTNKMSACCGSLSATLKYMKSGKVLWKPALCAILGALPGAYLGAEVLKLLNEQTVRVLMTVLVPLVALIVAFRGSRQPEPRPVTARTLWLCAGTGLVIGFYDGFFGPGTGTFLTLAFTWLCGMEGVTASGTSKPVNTASNLASLASFILNDKVLYSLALPAIVFSTLGGWVGSRLAVRRGAKFIRYVMLGVMGLIIVKLAYEWFA